MATGASTVLPYEQIPQEMTQRPQWVTWRYVKKRSKYTKLLFNPATGEAADSTAPETWGTYDEALSAMERRGHDGIGYVFAADDPYTGIDLDHCRDKETGEIAEWAQTWIITFASYAEISPSGEGVHVIMRASMAADARHKCGNYEAYDQERFFTVTGQHLEGTPATIEERQVELDAFAAACLPKSTSKRASAPQPQYAHSGGILDLDDGDILATALRDTKFAALWYGDMSGYPSHSEADFALLRKLDFYTWGDADRMDRFFRQSGLMHDKWDTRRGDTTLGGFNIRKILDTSTGERASYLHLLRSEPDAGDEANDTPEPEPENVVMLRARIVDLEAVVADRDETIAAKDATIAQLENELAGSRNANVRLNREITELKEYKRSRDEAEELRQVINALPSERLSVTDKLVLHCGIRHIRSAQSRGATREDGGAQFALGAAADEYDISTDTASKSVKRLESLGYWTRDYEQEFDPNKGEVDPRTGKKTGQWIKHLVLLPNEEYISQPMRAIEAAVEEQKPERNHGGDRRCPECGSRHVKAQTVYICDDCHHEWRSEVRDVNRATPEEETAEDATSAENFRYPQDAAIEQSITILPQVAGIGKNRTSRPTPASDAGSVTPPLCLHERTEHASPEIFRTPQDAAIAPRHVSPARARQEYDLFQWAKAHGWAKLPYVGGAPLGGDAETWGESIRKASDKQIALAYATITARVAAS